jgi:uncharacterized membrane protein YczE
MKLLQRHRPPVHPTRPDVGSLDDFDLLGRTELWHAASIDAHVMTRTRGGFAQFKGEVSSGAANTRAVALPVLKRLVRQAMAQLTTLSRISARPAEMARAVSTNTIRSQPMIVRAALVPFASIFIAVGVAAQLTAGLGIGPGDMIVNGISVRGGLTFGTAALLMSGSLALVGTLLGRPPRLGTVVNVAMIGPMIDLVRPHLVLDGGIGARVLHFGVGLWLIGIGLGCLLHARLGIGTHEAFSLAISDHTGVPVKRVRLAQEITWIALGVALGSSFGIGTVAVALFIGPAIAIGTRTVGRVLTAFSSLVEAPEVAAHVGDVGF